MPNENEVPEPEEVAEGQEVPQAPAPPKAPKKPSKAKKKPKKPKELPIRKLALSEFPQWIVNECDKIIFKNGTAADLRKFLKLTWHGGMKIPSDRSLRKYVSVRRQIIMENTDAKLELEKIIQQTEVNLTKLDKTDKIGYLQATVDLLAARIEHIKRLNSNLGDPRYEKIITDNLKQITTTLETIHKLETNVGVDAEILQIISDIMARPLLGAFLDAYKEVHKKPNLKLLGSSIDKHLDRLDFESIERDIEETVKQKKKEARSAQKT